MARYTGPKNKLSRREGIDLFGKGLKLRRVNVPPGEQGTRGRGKKLSEYGRQLREKQKVRRTYGVLERQFQKYVDIANKTAGATGPVLMKILENRLDNVVYRAGLAKSRPMARQLVVHGHIMVDGKRVDRPSYQISQGEVLTLSDQAMKMPDVIKLLEAEDTMLPKWLQRKAAAVHIVRIPEMDDIPEPVDTNMIVEYYSR